MVKAAVYCGASMPISEKLQDFATDTGSELARLGHTIIYGGSSKGLMGLVANGAIQMGGRVIGLTIPQLTSKEPPLEGVDIKICHTLPDRMLHFRESANVHLVLPGGFGTLEELSNVSSAMCFHHYGIDIEENIPPCPIYLLDDPEGLNCQLYAYLERSMEQGFINKTIYQYIELISLPAVMGKLSKARTLKTA